MALKKNKLIKFQEKLEKNDYIGEKTAKVTYLLSKKYIGKKVLDAGAGTGALIKYIPGAIGMDIAPRSKKIIKGDLTKIPFKENYFDTVFVCDVFEHLSPTDLKKALSEIKRVLKPNSYLILSVPFEEDLSKNKICCPKCGEKFHRKLHTRSFTKRDIVQVFEKFEVISMEQIPIGLLAKFRFLMHCRFIARFISNLARKVLPITFTRNGHLFAVLQTQKC
jgi:ubiquinone/menaquinone biosynthesis C-methylase UbiE